VGVKERTGSVGALREFSPSGGAECLGCDHSLSLREHRCFSRDLKAAALGLKRAVAFWRIGREVLIDLLHDSGGLDHLHVGIFAAGERVSSTHWGKGKR
jgi:hypothetical protein